uniref:CID domain-containing protein n=1 Tax=Panagrellus redivivus TaxID=6233 RepID=A0A7E4V0J9_PANRE
MKLLFGRILNHITCSIRFFRRVFYIHSSVMTTTFESFQRELHTIRDDSRDDIKKITQLAHRCAGEVEEVVRTISKFIRKQPFPKKLYGFYILDSIIKVESAMTVDFRRLFANCIVGLFLNTFTKADSNTRKRLYKCRSTWQKLLPQGILYHLDMTVRDIDPSWPLEHQNQRLRDQNRRCHDQLKALTTVAENNRHWRKSLLLSQSVTGALPVMLDHNRTSDDSGLTSDETSGENQHQATVTATSNSATRLPFSNKIHHYIPSANTSFVKNTAPTDLMTQSTSALMKRSPRQGRRPNAFPKTNIHVNPMSVSKAKSVKSSESDSPDSPPSTTDSSPWEVKSIIGNSNVEPTPVAPVPAPRRVKPAVPLRPMVIERDSLNSYADQEDDYGEYEEDDDEIFDEVDSPTTVEPSEPRRLPRCGVNATLANKDYVNLKDFVVVKDEPEGAMAHVYSDIIKTNAAPALPRHQPLIQFEAKLFRTAEKCLSIVDEVNPPSTSGENGYLLPQRGSDNRHPSSLASRESHPDSGLGRCSSERTAPVPDGMVLAHPPEQTASGRVSSAASEYAVPPDAASRLGRLRSRHGSPATPPLTVRTSVINQCEMELSGYLTAMSDNRLRSLKRRFVVLRNAELKFYRTNKHFIRDEPATMVINLRNVKAISKATSKCGNGFEITLDASDTQTTTHHRYQAESERATEEWYTALSTLLKNITIVDVASRTKPLEAELSGWLTKVKHGHQKRYFAQLVSDKLFFYKKPDEKVPLSCLSLRGARISDRHRSASSDESSAGSGDEQQAARGSAAGSSSASGIYAMGDGGGEYSVCVEVIDADPEYLILRTVEDKDRWLYYLRLAARDPSMHGTPFEVLVERLMASSAKDPLSSPLWDDILLRVPEENQVETLTTMPAELTKKALDMDAAAYLFTTVQIKPMAIQYHVDLAQNLLTSALPCVAMQNELYAQLIRLTSGSLPFDYQAWKLLALAIPLYLPKTYSLLWLLRNHIERVRRSHSASVPGRMAEYCSQALANRAKTGDRAEGPSKLEALTILTRDPMSTTHPYSIPVRLPTGDHQVVEFDGSTEIGQVLGSLCLKLNLRPAMLSGYALYASDPTGDRESDIMLLRGKAKLCDVLTFWERTSKDAHAGRVTADACSMRLQLRQRHYWSNLSDDETPTERLFLCHKLAEEVAAGHLPLSNDLAEELCALYAQMCYGDAPGPHVDDGLMDQILTKFYPKRLLEVVNIRALRHSVATQWHNNLHGVPLAECVRLVLLVLRKWKFFAAYIKEARMKIDDRRVFVALNENGIHILSDQFDVIRSFEFHRLITYGDFRNDFMLTVSRILPANAHPEESAQERLTFGMDKKAIEQMTIHITEYVRCQQLLWRMRQ